MIKGFTLIELLMSLFILSVVSIMGVPLAHNWYLKQLIDTTGTQLAHLVRYARSEAVLQGEPTIICPSSDGQHCGGSWDQGQIVFLDPRGEHKVTSSDQILRLGAAVKKPIKISLQSFARGNYLQFMPQGFVENSNGTLFLCSNDSNYGKTLIINRTGRVRSRQNSTVCYNHSDTRNQ